MFFFFPFFFVVFLSGSASGSLESDAGVFGAFGTLAALARRLNLALPPPECALLANAGPAAARALAQLLGARLLAPATLVRLFFSLSFLFLSLCFSVCCCGCFEVVAFGWGGGGD